MTSKTRRVRPASGNVILLSRSEYPRLHGYDKRAGYVVDAVDYVGWSIGRDLRRDRDAAGLSQAEVARRAGIRPETLSRLERGRGNPTVATVSKIVRAIRRAARARRPKRRTADR